MTRKDLADLAHENYLAALGVYDSACAELSRAVLARIAAHHQDAMAHCAEADAIDRLVAANADKKRLLESFSRAAGAAEGTA